MEVSIINGNTAQFDDRGNLVSRGFDDYRIENKLGEGLFGVVYKGVKLSGESPLLWRSSLYVAQNRRYRNHSCSDGCLD